MRALLILFCLSLCTSLHAMSPEYFSSRKWVEQRCATNTTPKDERLFVGRIVPREYAGIIHYHKGITLRGIVDQTPFKGTTVVVCVLRPKVDPATYMFSMKASDNPKFDVKAEDMIWIHKDYPIW
jgi:hypothetical protein